MNIPSTLKSWAITAYNLIGTGLGIDTAVTSAVDDYGGLGMASFGEPTPVLKDNLVGYLGVFPDMTWNYYRPAISLIGLAKTMDANAYHGSILRFKRNQLARWFQPSPVLGWNDFRMAALDYHVFGAAYFQMVYNVFGNVIALRRRPALLMRRGVEPGVFFELRDYRHYNKPLEYLPGEIVCIMEDDVKQTIYGVPEYIGGIQSVLLGEASVLFRRNYYLNGAHLGYILVTTDANLPEDVAKKIDEKIKESKGPGNFRSMYLNIPRSTSKEPVKIIPVGDIATKDDFDKVSNITKTNCLAMHRMQPGIAGVIPENMTGFGDLEKIMWAYHDAEVVPMQQQFLMLNDVLPRRGRIAFSDPDWAKKSSA